MSTPPMIRLTDELVLAGTYLPTGPLVPRVYLPLVRDWTETEVVIAAGERTRTLDLGGDPSHLHQSGAWDHLSPVFGVGQAIQVQGDIEYETGQAHRCAGCAATRPWSIEWVTGALLLTGTVECRSCWHRDRRPWAVETARRIAVVWTGRAHEGDGDLHI